MIVETKKKSVKASIFIKNKYSISDFFYLI